MNKGGQQSRILLPVVPQLDGEFRLTGPQLAPLRVWQARPGEILTVVDPQNCCYRARISSFSEDQATLIPFAILPAESRIELDIYQALPDKERFELILQKLTELGVARVIPFSSSRSATLAERDAKQKKSHRWPDVVLRAARQCRRAELPELWWPVSWEDCCRSAAMADQALLLYEGEEQLSLRNALRSFEGHRAALIIGPEGGFTPVEVDQACQSGIVPVGLGSRILRTETAAIAGAAVMQYELGSLS